MVVQPKEGQNLPTCQPGNCHVEKIDWHFFTLIKYFYTFTSCHWHIALSFIFEIPPKDLLVLFSSD